MRRFFVADFQVMYFAISGGKLVQHIYLVAKDVVNEKCCWRNWL